MLTLLSEVKFLSTNDDIDIKDDDFGAFKYQEKRIPSNHEPHAEGKQNYAEQRNHQYVLDNRKSKKIRTSIRKFEDQLKQNRVICCAWRDNVVLQLLLSNGLLVHICFNIFTGDIIRMAFDRFFIGKLISECVTDAIITRMHIIIAYDENQLTFVHLQKPSLKRSAPEKISRMDPKIFNIIINGQSRKIARHLTCNSSFDLLIVWTKSSQNVVYPWKPTGRDQDLANVHIYRLNRSKLDLLCYYWTENDPITIEFSKLTQNQLRTIEQKVSRKGEVSAEIVVYELIKTKIHRIGNISIPLQSQVCSHAFSPDNERLMLGCIDGSVVLFDEGRGITHSVKAAFIPKIVNWHADSAIIMIANDKCQFQFFDIALSCIRNCLLNEECTPFNVLNLSGYFLKQPNLRQIYCSKKPLLSMHTEKYVQTDSFVFMLFDDGPISMLRLVGGSGLRGDVYTAGFTPDTLIHQYLKLGSVERAINLLLCMNWNTNGAMCLSSLHGIANFIFKQPLKYEREVQMQKALGSFHVPVKSLTEETEIEFGDQVRDITRKLFQYLLRYRSFEKAFNLAVDLNDEDLFLDLYNTAKENGQSMIAEDAFKKAEELLTRNDSRTESHSSCTRDSCSVCDSSSYSDDDNTRSWKRRTKPINNIKERQKNGSNANVIVHNEQTPKYHKNTKKTNSNSAQTNRSLNLTKLPVNIPKPEIRASTSANSRCKLNPSNGTSHMLAGPLVASSISRSASQYEFSEFHVQQLQRKPKLLSNNSFSIDYVNDIDIGEPVHLKYQPQLVEKVPRPLPRASMQCSGKQHLIPQHHEVIDVVPKPKPRAQTIEWNIPDQTLGIPLTDPAPLHDISCDHPYQSAILLPSHPQIVQPPLIYHPRPLNRSKSLHTIPLPNTIPQIIHHPLISGNIPPSFHSGESYLIKTKMPLNQSLCAPPPPPKPAHRQNGSSSSSILSSSTQQSAPSRRENGERNKVKFSDTVTVAVVPDIPRREKYHTEKPKRSNVYRAPGMSDSRKELQDSLPLCHPHDDYLKDFNPMNLSSERESSPSSSVQESVLTWV